MPRHNEHMTPSARTLLAFLRPEGGAEFRIHLPVDVLNENAVEIDD